MTALDLIPVMWKITPEFMDRIWVRTERVSGDCLLWTGPLDAQGYGHVSARRAVDGAHVGPLVHTVVYEATNMQGRPSGYEVDHTCHSVDLRCHGGPSCVHRRCINPDHLELVTVLVNRQRAHRNNHQANKTHCAKGHEYTPENTYRFPSRGYTRQCKACTSRIATTAYNAKKPAA